MKFFLNTSETTGNFETQFSTFVSACWCAHFEKKSWKNLHLSPSYSLGKTEDHDFCSFFQCFFLNKLKLFFIGSEFRVAVFLIVCSISRAFFPNGMVKFVTVSKISSFSWRFFNNKTKIFSNFPSILTSVCIQSKIKCSS